jgi:hypothetical protein
VLKEREYAKEGNCALRATIIRITQQAIVLNKSPKSDVKEREREERREASACHSARLQRIDRGKERCMYPRPNSMHALIK